MQSLKIKQVLNLFKNNTKNLSFLDIRERKQYVHGFAFGSVNCPFSKFEYLIKELDLRPELFESDYILIENQPAFKNPKMKSIQMIVYTYYLMRSKLDGKRPQQKICFLMASNKLKVSLDTEENKNSLIQKIHNKTNDKYRRHKELSKEYCQWFLNDDESENWFNHYQEHKKKDDLADTFLMCIYGKQNSNKF